MIAMEHNHFMILLYTLIGIAVFFAIAYARKYMEVKVLKAEIEVLHVHLGLKRQDGMFAGLVKGMQQSAPPPIKGE